MVDIQLKQFENLSETMKVKNDSRYVYDEHQFSF